MFLNAVRGFCMALADSVPGVSGGTIAFLLGFYDEFINSLNDMIGKDNAKRKSALIFLIKLGIGWVIGFGASVMVLSSLFQVHIYEISSVYPVCYPIGSKRRVGQYKRKGWLPCVYPDRYGTGILHLLF
mgnify:CR=1 FL=1